MSATEYLVDTNILIYHTKGAPQTSIFINNLISRHSLNVDDFKMIEGLEVFNPFEQSI